VFLSDMIIMLFDSFGFMPLPSVYGTLAMVSGRSRLSDSCPT
jgi:hypothetical protein